MLYYRGLLLKNDYLIVVLILRGGTGFSSEICPPRPKFIRSRTYTSATYDPKALHRQKKHKKLNKHTYV